MGALANFIERAGVATASISLIREQSEAVKPPRALWVPDQNQEGFSTAVVGVVVLVSVGVAVVGAVDAWVRVWTAVAVAVADADQTVGRPHTEDVR